MFDFVFALLAIAAASNPSPQTSEGSGETAAASSVVIGNGVQIGAGVISEGLPYSSEIDTSVIPQTLVADLQNPEGKFTTATEVKPILTATKANWVAVREYGENDLVYVTHLWSWRCGLGAMAIAINDAPLQDMPLPACHTEFATPNAILEQDGLPYLTYPQGSVERIRVQIVYDDLTAETATYSRGDVLIP
ncbi:hypothetical protein OS189_08515 [Sulfitobacter sp. F26169L]|uniref:hypothetical protein n=1 Tax=Sulfitobacter sp. F26169L TaxID=2996015 RepID=UPI002260D3F7|nr:hypothetical protein [Sulfitobacter sp. F26169L]MCX7566383.1 hypothetical protein [Sulfitobacter sp. F26169L]